MEDKDQPIKTVADQLMDAFNGIKSARAQRASKLKDIRLVIEVGKANQLPEENLNDYFRNATLTEEIQIMITVINSSDPFGNNNLNGAASERFIRQLAKCLDSADVFNDGLFDGFYVEANNDNILELKTFMTDEYISSKIQHNCDWLDYENLLLMIMYSPTFDQRLSSASFVKRVTSQITNKLSKKYNEFINEIYFKYDQSKIKNYNERNNILLNDEANFVLSHDEGSKFYGDEGCDNSFRDDSNRMIHEEGSFYHEDDEGDTLDYKNQDLLEFEELILDKSFDYSDDVPQPIQKQLSTAYKIAATYEKQGTNQGRVYGELSLGSFKKIVKYLKAKCNMNEHSRFIDIGSGLGKPNFHVALDSKIALSIGVECEKPRHQLAMKILQEQIQNSIFPYRTGFVNLNIADATTFDPFSIVYSFDKGFEPALMQSIASIWNASNYAEYFISYKTIKEIVTTYEFDVIYIESIRFLIMKGSSEGKTAHVFKRKMLTIKPTKKRLLSLSSGQRCTIDNDTFLCDEIFMDVFNTVMKPRDEFIKFVDNEVDKFLNSGRQLRNAKI